MILPFGSYGIGKPRVRSIVRVLSIMRKMPTKIPRYLGGMRWQVYAAIGAAIMPPMMSGIAMNHRKFAKPSVNPKVMTMATVVKNSATFTEPMMVRGSCFLLDTRVEVHMGPHPPPPKASKVPPIKPKMRSFFLENASPENSVCFSLTNRNRIRAPKAISINPTGILTKFGSTWTRKIAPRIPPITPGTSNGSTISRRTFRNLKCETPDAKLAKISAE